MTRLNPHRTDFVFNTISFFGRKNPALTGFVYLLFSIGGSVLLASVTGRLHGYEINGNGTATKIEALYSARNLIDNINMAFLAPVGAVILCYLYKTIKSAFEALLSSDVIHEEDQKEYTSFLGSLQEKYDNRIIVVACVIISISINTFNYLSRGESWLGYNGGLPGIFGRLCVALNYYIIFLIVYKSIVTVWAMRRIMGRFKLKIRPFHPDKCGGLLPFGQLSAALTYFLSIILTYVSILIFFDPLAQGTLIYTAIIAAFYIASPILLFGSLSKAHDQMEEIKNESMKNLGRTFDHYYQKLSSSNDPGIIDLDVADQVLKIHGYYQIVDKMPVWPFDTQTLSKLGGSFLVPLALYIFQQIEANGSMKEWLTKIYEAATN